MTDKGESVSYRCWCEHEDCEWTRDGEERDGEVAQEVAAAKMAAHGVQTGHFETYRELHTGDAQ